MDNFSSFNGAGPSGGGANHDGHGQGRAALLLIEGLMHALVEKGIISREDFIEIVEGGAEVEHELATTNASYPPYHNGSLLSPLADAFKKELGR